MYAVKLIAVVIVSYLLGSISCSIIASKLLKKGDVRSKGSGNAGLTNAYRTGGPVVAVLTLLGDSLKGVLAVLLGGFIMSAEGVLASNFGMYSAAVAVMLGHIFPVFFKFKGGKGVLTSATVLAILNYKAFLVVFAVFIIVFVCTRIVSASSLAAAVTLPVAVWILPDTDFKYGILFLSVISVIIILKHSSNLYRLINRQEKKFVFRKKDEDNE